MLNLDKKYCLKSLEEKHLDSLVQLDQLCLGGLWTKDGYRRELKSPNSELLGLFNDQDSLIGFGCFWAIVEEAHITVLMVHPNYRGQGLGEFLLISLLKAAVKRQLERATLEVRESNQVALSLYKKFGFKVAGKRKGYYKKIGEDALILWRSGLDHPDFLLSL